MGLWCEDLQGNQYYEVSALFDTLHIMSVETETTIRKLCIELQAVRDRTESERIIEQLRTAIADHMIGATTSLTAQAGNIGVQDTIVEKTLTALVEHRSAA